MTMLCFPNESFNRSSSFILLILLTNNYYGNQLLQVKAAVMLPAMVTATIPLPICSHFSHYATVRTTTDNNEHSRSLIIPKSRIITHFGESSIPITFEQEFIQKLKCDEEKSEIRIVSLNTKNDPGRIVGRNFKNVTSAISDANQTSYLTSSGIFYDSTSKTYYKPDGDYCVLSYSIEEITVKICSVGDQCTSSSSPTNTWGVPKCCAIDEVFRIDESRCARLSRLDDVSPWIPPIYKSPENPHHKIDDAFKHLQFQMANLPKNCNAIRLDDGSETAPHISWSLASSITIGNVSYPKSNIKLAAPADGTNGMISPLYFHNGSRKWKPVENLASFCVDGFYFPESGSFNSSLSNYSGNPDEFILVVCQKLNNSPNIQAGSSFLSHLNSWTYSAVVFAGVIALLAIIVVYGLIWGKLNLHGLIILNFTLATLGDYWCIGVWARLMLLFHKINLFDLQAFEFLCSGTGILSHYFLLTAYLWLTVMNFDLWLTFITVQTVNGKSKQWRKFSLYSICTWGFAFALVTTFVIIDQVYKDPTTEFPVPRYGSTLDCYMSPYFAPYYVITPLLIIFAMSITLIVLTTKVFIKARRERNTRLSGSIMSNVTKYSVKMFAKLFVVMGLGWNVLTLANFLSWVYYEGNNPWPLAALHYIVYLTPIYLFVLFCLNDRVINQLKDKYPNFSKKLDAFRKVLQFGRKCRDRKTKRNRPSTNSSNNNVESSALSSNSSS